MLLRRVLFLVAVAAFVVFLAPTQVGGNTGYVSVNGKSMLPLLKDGSLALVREAPHYRVGDVVAYRYPRVGVVIHRIVRERADGTFTLKGDNNAWLDGYHPRPEEVVGKLWFHTKTLGRLAKSIQSPANAAILVGVVGTAVVATDSSEKEQRRRRGGSRRRGGQRPRSALSGQSVEKAFLTALALVAASGVLALFALRHPGTVVRDRLTTFEQRATFSYTAQAPPGIYDTSTLQAGDPIFPRLTPQVEVGVEYALTSTHPVTADGTYRFVARIEHPTTGWKRSFEVAPPAPFTGQRFSAKATLNLPPIIATTRALEEAAELQPGQTYRFTFGVEVTSRGLVDQAPFEERYEPMLRFVLAPAAAVLDSSGDDKPLEESATGGASRRIDEANEVRVLWVDTEVRQLQIVALAGLGMAGLAAIVIWGSFARRRSDPVLGVEARFGHLLATVGGGKLAPTARRIRVETMDDLAKLAEQEGRMILHEAGSRAHRYLVLSDEVIYYYLLTLDGNPGHPESEPDEHVPA